MVKKAILVIVAMLLSTGCISTHNRWTKIIVNKSDLVVGIGAKYTSPNTLESEDFNIGTGFIVQKNVVATAGHVIKALMTYESLSNPYIMLENNKKLEIDVVYFDDEKDVGIIITKGMKTNSKLFLRYDLPLKGEDTITLGHPRSVMYTASRGSVMNIVKRPNSFKQNMDMIYIGSRIAGGASGSPMMDVNGYVIGVVVEIRYDQYGWYNSNVSPSKYLKKLLVSYNKEKNNKRLMDMRREIYNLNKE